MKAHIGADGESGLVHHVHGTAANVADVTQVAELLHGEENAVYADAGYTGVEKRDEHENREVIWQIAARRSTYSRLNKHSRLYKAKRKIEYCQAQTRAKVEHPYMDSSSLQAPSLWHPCRLHTYIRPLTTASGSMLGHDGLFARRLPIVSPCFSHLDA